MGSVWVARVSLLSPQCFEEPKTGGLLSCNFAFFGPQLPFLASGRVHYPKPLYVAAFLMEWPKSFSQSSTSWPLFLISLPHLSSLITSRYLFLMLSLARYTSSSLPSSLWAAKQKHLLSKPYLLTNHCLAHHPHSYHTFSSLFPATHCPAFALYPTHNHLLSCYHSMSSLFPNTHCPVLCSLHSIQPIITCKAKVLSLSVSPPFPTTHCPTYKSIQPLIALYPTGFDRVKKSVD